MARVVFLGYGEYGAASLRGLARAHQVVLAFTHPSPPGRHSPVDALAIELGIRLHHSERLAQTSDVDLLSEAKPDFLVSTNWRRQVADSALATARLAALNVHDSLLPRYAGLCAEQWVVRNDETRTGVTVHVMTPSMDMGGIVCQQEIPIGPDDHAAEVARRQIAVYPDIIVRAIADYTRPGFTPIVHPASAYERWHAITEDDLRVDWTRGPREIMNMIRAHSDPYAGCFFTIRGRRLRLKAARMPAFSCCGTPGRVVAFVDDGVLVATGQDRRAARGRGIVLQHVQDEGGEIRSARDVLPRNAQLA
ncbi:methionyl-tRNA formyltransferase [Sorangium cellulosum]|uniref:methionyl-tRNA formyltransferase n=1 Tax=Sorangium cellulosum TaxID=56 RepID=UPI003D9A2217